MGSGCTRARDTDPHSDRIITVQNSVSDIKHNESFNVNYTDFIRKKTGMILEDYKIKSAPLGKGAYGEVRKAIHKITGVERAVKMINKDALDESEKSRLVTEVEILKKIDHPHIMKIYEFYEDERYFYIISELLRGGELFERIIDQVRLEEDEAAKILKQILSAVSYCHKNNIVHRDLKPENIIYATTDFNSPLKLIDFGTSACFKENEILHQKFGTPYYIAPEVIKRNYDTKCDIWSCGVILYVILSGKPPFNGDDEKEIMEKVALGAYKIEGVNWEGISEEAKDFVRQLMTFDPKLRPDAETALNNPWMKFFDKESKAHVDKKSAQLALENLRKFRIKNKLQHAIWIFLVQNLATNDEQKKLMQLFEALDKDGNGMLNKQELISGYKKISNTVDATNAVEKIMKTVDINQSGSIDYMEFVMATMNKRKLLTKKTLEKAFKLIDKDGNGFITKDEIKQTFKSVLLDEPQWVKLIREVDKNGDGQISLEEFKLMMLKNS